MFTSSTWRHIKWESGIHKSNPRDRNDFQRFPAGDGLTSYVPWHWNISSLALNIMGWLTQLHEFEIAMIDYKMVVFYWLVISNFEMVMLFKWRPIFISLAPWKSHQDVADVAGCSFHKSGCAKSVNNPLSEVCLLIPPSGPGWFWVIEVYWGIVYRFGLNDCKPHFTDHR